MKKLSLVAAILTCTFAASAQKGKVNLANASLNENDLPTAKTMIDEALSNEKSISWPKTYVVAGKIYAQLQATGKDEEGLKKAIEYFAKAEELDAKGDEKGKNIGKYQKDIKTGYTFLKPSLVNAGADAFNNKNFEGALFAFENVIRINELEMFKADNLPVDTAYIYNAALAAYNAENWAKADVFFNKALAYKYGGGDVILLLNQVYSNQKDSSKIEANLNKGLTLFPEDSRILTYLIQYYLDNGNAESAIKYIQTAIEKEPTNSLYYSALGELYEKLDKQKAVESYQKALEINPTHFGSLYNLGALYFNMGVELQNVANDKKSDKEYQAGMVLANAEWKKSIPYMEKALEAATKTEEKLAVLDILKGLYYRFMKESGYKGKYDSVVKQIETLKAL